MTSVKSRPPESLAGQVRSIAWALLIALFFRTTTVQAYSIPTGSATPTLQVGDYVLVSKFAYGYSRFSLPIAPDFLHGRLFGASPKRGDYVVFSNPKDGEITIKRIVGLPGDHVQVTHGILIINGEPCKRTPNGTFLERDWNDTFHQPEQVLRYRYVETMPNGVTHDILGSPVAAPEDSGPVDNTEVYVVPAGHYFGMGDSRDNSADSRFMDELGYIPEENLIGRAEFRLFSLQPGVAFWQIWKWPSALRLGRFFGAVT
jgi:signal peptidase I